MRLYRIYDPGTAIGTGLGNRRGGTKEIDGLNSLQKTRVLSVNRRAGCDADCVGNPGGRSLGRCRTRARSLIYFYDTDPALIESHRKVSRTAITEPEVFLFIASGRRK